MAQALPHERTKCAGTEGFTVIPSSMPGAIRPERWGAFVGNIGRQLVQSGIEMGLLSYPTVPRKRPRLTKAQNRKRHRFYVRERRAKFVSSGLTCDGTVRKVKLRPELRFVRQVTNRRRYKRIYTRIRIKELRNVVH